VLDGHFLVGASWVTSRQLGNLENNGGIIAPGYSSSTPTIAVNHTQRAREAPEIADRELTVETEGNTSQGVPEPSPLVLLTMSAVSLAWTIRRNCGVLWHSPNLS